MKTGMPGMVKGMISMNFLAVEEILISIDGLIKRLYSKNERIRHTISRLERCTGTRENPHDHNVEISAYTRVLRKNEKDIKNLSTIYGQIDNFKNCTQQTDQRLAKLIYDTFPEYVTPKAGGMTRSMSGSSEEMSISEQAARNANLLVIAGRPQINSAYDYLAFKAAMSEIKASQTQVISNEYGSYYIKDGVPIITYTFPGTNVGERGYTYTSKELSLPEEQQLFAHKLCEGTNVDPFLVMATIAHESGSNPNVIEKIFNLHTGLMQINPKYTDEYLNINSDCFKNSKEILDSISLKLSASELSTLINSSEMTEIIEQKQEILKDPYINIALGVAIMNQWQIDKKGDQMLALKGQCGDSYSPKEMFYYADQLRELLGEEPQYTEYYNKEIDE